MTAPSASYAATSTSRAGAGTRSVGADDVGAALVGRDVTGGVGALRVTEPVAPVEEDALLLLAAAAWRAAGRRRGGQAPDHRDGTHHDTGPAQSPHGPTVVTAP